MRRRQARQGRVARHETRQRLGAIADDVERIARIFAPVGGQRFGRDELGQRRGHRADRRQRIVELVTEHAQQALPGEALFFAQRAAEIGDDEQIVRPAAFAETRAADFPATAAAGKRALDQTRVDDIEPVSEREIGCDAAVELRKLRAEQALGGRIRQLQSHPARRRR